MNETPTTGSDIRPTGSRIQNTAPELHTTGSKIQYTGSRIQKIGSTTHHPGSTSPNTGSRIRPTLRPLALTAALAATAFTFPPATALAAPAQDGTVTLTIRHLDRSGADASAYTTHVTGVSGPGADVREQPHDPSGTVTLRLPKGRYLLDSTLEAPSEGSGTDWIVQPRLDLDHDTTVTVDARTTAPVDVRPPEDGARPRHAVSFVEVNHGGATRSANLISSATGLRVAHLGPAAEPGSVTAWVDSYWSGARADYGLGYRFTSDRALTGLVRKPAPADLATLRVRAADRDGTGGTGFVSFQPSEGTSAGLTTPVTRPGIATFLVTPERGRWDLGYTAPGTAGAPPNQYEESDVPVRAGASTTHTFDNAVLGPALDPSADAPPAGVRDGDRLSLDLPLLADGDGHAPSAPAFRSATTTLHRDGVLVGTHRGDPGRASFTLDAPDRARYRLTATALHGTGTRAGRTTAVWTFDSAATTAPTALPLSVVRFTPPLALDGTAPAGTDLRVPVTVQGPAAGAGLRSLRVQVSADGGTTWAAVPVVDGAVVIRNPAQGRTVSLRATLTDTEGNTLDQTLGHAYRTR
ncbi:serine protease [Streptomyces sp. CC208A]|uniref:serine protease n=1 Tax=Streptomyces sp. CC208A TaxID=3044573 RepID=UPI0024A9595C|nr:serine protease [Streptomyces sp. CC208A]